VIYEIWSPTRPGFKRLRFKPGLNIVSVRRTDTASATGKRNAAGKSSLLDIIHYIFGGNREAGSPLSAAELATDEFKITSDIGTTKVTLMRSNATPQRVEIEGDVHKWPRAPEINKETGLVSMPNDAWCDLLGRVFFGLPPASNLGAGEFLSFRACFAYFVRRQRTGGYMDWRRHFIQQRPVSWQVALGYLFGLDREGTLRLHRIKEAERQKGQLEKLLKSEFASIAMPSTAKLRIASRKLERQLQKLEAQLSGYKVIDYYDDLVEEANSLQQQIGSLNNANVLDDELARDIAVALRSENPPAIPDLVQLYEEAGVILRSDVTKRYSEVEEFHRAVVANRQEHLKAELRDTNTRIQSRKDQISQLSSRRNFLLDTLSSGGALDQYRRLDNQLHSIRSEYETIKRQLELAERIDAMRMDLKVQKAEAERQIRQDLTERRDFVEEAALIFDDISQSLYDQPAVFDVVAGKDGLDFKIEAPEIASDGIRQVQIFTFDLTLASVCARRGKWPGFLVHDSHIFDGVDGRQIALALRIASERISLLKGQYIVTMNSDDLEKAQREGGISFSEFIVEPELDDSPSGCLFGFRFGTDDDPLNRPGSKSSSPEEDFFQRD
jgi:uncharacterized protein YydD (DUF2326 family)